MRSVCRFRVPFWMFSNCCLHNREFGLGKRILYYIPYLASFNDVLLVDPAAISHNAFHFPET